MRRYNWIAIVFMFIFALPAGSVPAASIYSARTSAGYYYFLGKDGTTSASASVKLQFDVYWPTSTPYSLNNGRGHIYVSLLNPTSTGTARATSLPAVFQRGIFVSLEYTADTAYRIAVTQYNDAATSSAVLQAATSYTSPALSNLGWHRFVYEVNPTTFTLTIDGDTTAALKNAFALNQAIRPTGDYFIIGARQGSANNQANAPRFDNIWLNDILSDSFESYADGALVDPATSAWVQENTAAGGDWIVESASNSTLGLTPVELSSFNIE